MAQPAAAERRWHPPEGAAVIDADEHADAFAFNEELERMAADCDVIVVQNPRARHNLGVALTRPVHVIFDGSVGYYCGGFNDGAFLEVRGNAGWGLGEAMASGRIVVHGSTAWAAGASMRGGTIVIRGDGGPRTGIAMKGGSILVGGSLGFMSGFMAHRGKIVALGGAGDALGASMYEGRIFVAGLPWPTKPLRKIVAEGRLWFFDAKDAAIWRHL